MQYTAAVITDLDGTLLDPHSKLSQDNLNTLYYLGELGVLRIAATGRSLYSVRKVFDSSAPFEYVIFSTGCGIYDWKNQRLLLSHSLEAQDILKVLDVVQAQQYDFMLHAPVPENHWFEFLSYSTDNLDFHSRVALYQSYAKPFSFDAPPQSASEILVVTPAERSLDAHQMLLEHCPDLSIIPVTSPLDHASFWVEVFSPEVSKSQAAQYLMQLEGIDDANIMAIGNDYNDIDLLDWATHSYIVSNAPAEIKTGHIEVLSHCQNGFSEAVHHWLKR